MYQPQHQSASVYLFFFFSPLFVLTASIRNFTWETYCVHCALRGSGNSHWASLSRAVHTVLWNTPRTLLRIRSSSITCLVSMCSSRLELPDSVEGYGMGGTGKTSEPAWIGHKPHARMTTSPRYGCFLSYQSVLRLILPQSCS